MTKGAFDSQNLAFWDASRGSYGCYSLIFSTVRAIQISASPDFFQWSEGVPIRYAANAPVEHFYTSAAVPCPTAPHLMLAFPKRIFDARKKLLEHKHKGVSDAVFVTKPLRFTGNDEPCIRNARERETQLL